MKFKASTLAERKEMLGESLYCQIKEMYSNSELAGKITGMSGASLERVRRVHPHPLKFDNGCAAPVLRAEYLY